MTIVSIILFFNLLSIKAYYNNFLGKWRLALKKTLQKFSMQYPFFNNYA
ncbi:hypothetical protein ACVWYN_000122 [Pedobacter sp. UYP24]